MTSYVVYILVGIVGSCSSYPDTEMRGIYKDLASCEAVKHEQADRSWGTARCMVVPIPLSEIKQ
jgi:hypothetical protein